MAKDTQLLLRIDSDLKNRIKRAAKDEGCSVTEFILRMARAAVAKKEMLEQIFFEDEVIH